MSHPKISIIIPVYNTQSYLEQCIASVLNQSFKDFEMLLIDDGSTDNSGKICDEFALKDSRIKVFHKENRGVSSARNLGICNASGEWITFIDSDDWVEPNFLKNFSLDSLKPKDLHIQKIAASSNGTIRKVKPAAESDATLSDPQSIKDLDEYMLFGETVGKLYNTKIIKDNKLCFDDTISLHEDHLFYFSYLIHAKRIVNTRRIGYHYRRDTNTASLSSGLRHVNYLELLHSYSNIYDKWSIILNIANLKPCDLKRTTHFIFSIKLSAIRMAFLQKAEMEEIKSLLKTLKLRDVFLYYRPRSKQGFCFKIILFLPLPLKFFILSKILKRNKLYKK